MCYISVSFVCYIYKYSQPILPQLTRIILCQLYKLVLYMYYRYICIDVITYYYDEYSDSIFQSDASRVPV